MKKQRVLYLINYAPDYRDKFLSELGKRVELTVASYGGGKAELKNPNERKAYTYVPIKRRNRFGFNLNPSEFTLGNGDFDVIIVGYTLWSVFRMANLFRRKKRVICEGIIFGTHKGRITKGLRRVFINRAEGLLVYSRMTAEKLAGISKMPIIAFNNTAYRQSEVTPIPPNPIRDSLNVLWVGRHQKRKKIERLYELAKTNKRVFVRVIGPGIKQAFQGYPPLPNFDGLDAVYGNGLKPHFAWCHLVMNPGGIGLLLMNAARFSRPVSIDRHSYHGPEVQLAIDAEQDFIDFSDSDEVGRYIEAIFDNPGHLEEKGRELCAEMYNYTIENMVAQYLKAINGDWPQ